GRERDNSGVSKRGRAAWRSDIGPPGSAPPFADSRVIALPTNRTPAGGRLASTTLSPSLAAPNTAALIGVRRATIHQSSYAVSGGFGGRPDVSSIAVPARELSVIKPVAPPARLSGRNRTTWASGASSTRFKNVLPSSS